MLTRSRAVTAVRAFSVILGVGLALAQARPAAAVDPSAAPEPTPLVFHNPQYLVWMDGHSTYNGPVEDKAYWLYIAPDVDGRFVVPAGDNTVFHYAGRTIGGPFSGEADACPAMLAVGVVSLQAWAVAAGETAQIVDCSRYLATEAPATAEPGPTGDGTSPSGDPNGSGAGPGSDDDVDPESLGLAVALIGALLFGGGGLLVATGGRPRRTRDDATTRRDDPPSDPCASQAAEVARASLAGRYLNDVLATCRRHEALLQEQIDVLANLVLPGSVMLDLGFAAGGLSGGLAGPLGRKLIASATFRGAIGEAVVKDVVKEIGKQALGSAGGGVDTRKLRMETIKSGVKATLLGGAREGIVNQRFFDTALPTAPTKVFRGVAEYTEFMRELTGFADEVASPITDGLGALLDLYEGVTGAIELKERLDTLRALRDRIADKRVDLELRMEDALDRHRFAAERLAHCRRINDPGWRP